MKIKYATIFILLLFFVNGFSQNTLIKGSVKDTLSFKSVAFSSVSLIKLSDSTLIKNLWINEFGDFEFLNFPADTYLLQITRPSFVDYTEKTIVLENQKINLGTIHIISKANLLKEIIIKDKISAIRIKGDTTEFLVDSFLVNKNSNVEDLLKRLPGIQVDKDGKITAQGQQVKKVLVDGEEFFGNDPTIATKNIKAENISTVQVFDKKSDQATLTGIDDGEKNKTINLTLKENAKKGYFGKLSALEGKDAKTNAMFERDAMYNYFKNKLKVSAYAASSNTNKTGLSWEDRETYTGGGASNMEMSDNGMMYSYYNNESDFSGVGIPQTTYYGGYFSNKFNNEKQMLNGNITRKDLTVNAEDNNYTKYILPDTLYFNNQLNTIRNAKVLNSANANYEFNIDSTLVLKIKVKTSQGTNNSNNNFVTQNLNENGNLINDNVRDLNNLSTNQSLNTSISLNKKFKLKGRSLAFNFDGTSNSNLSEGFLKSKTNYYNPDSTINNSNIIDQKKINENYNSTLKGFVSYTEPLSKKWFIVTDYDISNSVNNSKRISYDKSFNNEYSNVLDSLSNSLRYNIFTNKGGIAFKFNTKKLTYSLGGKVTYTDLRQLNLNTNKEIGQYFFNIFPAANLLYKIKNTSSLSANYNGYTRQPSLQQIQPLLDNSNPLDIYLGNQNLGQSFTNSFSLTYNSYKPLTGSSLYSNLSFNMVNNDFTSYDKIDNFGRKTHQTLNVDGNYSANFYSYYYFKIKKINLGISNSISGNISLNNNFINGYKNTNNNQSLSYGLDLDFEVKEKFEIYLNTDFNFNNSTSSLRQDIKTQFWTQEHQLSVGYYLPLKFELGGNCKFNIRQKTSDFDRNLNTTIFNAFISKKLLKKDALEIKFTVNDIFNQNIGFNRTANSNYINERTYTVLQRYFLIGLIWNFSKGGSND